MKPLQNRHRFVCYFKLNVSYELVFFFVYLYLPSPRVRRADILDMGAKFDGKNYRYWKKING